MNNKNYIFKFGLLLFLITATNCSFAQTTVNAHAGKYKPPVVKIFLGDHSGNDSIITAAVGKGLVAMPLKISDDKGNSYPIESYQLLYKRTGVTEDEETGKASPETDEVSNRFDETPLTPIWIKTIQETLHAGEELYFFDVVATDKKGTLFFAPNLRLIIN